MGQKWCPSLFKANYAVLFITADAPAQFSIDRDTGLITVDPNNPLDYETNTTYSFTVVANDMGNVPCPVRAWIARFLKVFYIVLLLEPFKF